MAIGTISFAQKPVNSSDQVPVITNYNPLIGYMVYQDDISGLFYFKLVVEVRITNVSGNVIAKLKQRRNGFPADNAGGTQRARAYFDIRDIANTQIVDTVFDQNDPSPPFRSIHGVSAGGSGAKIFSANGDNQMIGADGTNTKTQIVQLCVKAYQEYAANATDVPVEKYTPTVNDTWFYMAASYDLFKPRSVNTTPGSAYLQSNTFNEFALNTNAKRFLSDMQKSTAGIVGLPGLESNLGKVRRTYIDYNEMHTLAFLNDATNFNTNAYQIEVKYYAGSAALASNQFKFQSTAGFGGIAPNDAGLIDKQRILYFGCGTYNLDQQTIDADVRPSTVISSWTHYTVQALDASNNAVSDLYYFIKRKKSTNDTAPCKGYKVRRLAFRNSLGCYDYFSFTSKSSQTLDIKRNTYNSLIGNFSSDIFYYNDDMRGKNTRQTTAVLKETLNSGWITEEDADLMEKLIYSTSVYVTANNDTTYTEAVIVTDSNFVRKTVANEKLIQYTINIEYANPINTNS